MEITREDVHVAARMLANNCVAIHLAEVQSQLAKNLATTGSDGAVLAALEELADETPPRLQRTGASWAIGESAPSHPIYQLMSEENED